MADGMLFLRCHLAEGALIAFWHENGVIAEAPVAPGRPDELPLDPPLEDLEVTLGGSQCQGADEFRAPIGVSAQLLFHAIHREPWWPDELPHGSPHEFAGDQYGRTLHFGIREHAMGSILNGITLHGGTRPYGGTFLVFSDYMRAAVRLGLNRGGGDGSFADPGEVWHDHLSRIKDVAPQPGRNVRLTYRVQF